MSNIYKILIPIALAMLSFCPVDAATDHSPNPLKILQDLDARRHLASDFRAVFYLEQKARKKDDLIYKAVVFRRDESDKLLILFLKPKSEAGKGYLKIKNNLFLYEPTIGKWERRTSRERIAGTESRRADFEKPHFSKSYQPLYVSQEKLGVFDVHHLKLTAKKGADVAYPVVHLWIDVSTGNLLKQQEYALSGKLMRTCYYPKWKKIYDKRSKRSMYIPHEIRIFDEVEKGNRTSILMDMVSLDDIDENVFTKAWLESKSK